MINSCGIILEKIKISFFAKNHCAIQVCNILIRTLYSIKYGRLLKVDLINGKNPMSKHYLAY
jgi:hypothetical protein